MRLPVAVLLVVSGVSNSGCSFIYTKGPQPEVQPPPPCTTSNAAPTADAIIGGLGAVGLVTGLIVGASYAGENCTPGFECIGTGVGTGAGFGAAIAGGIVAAIFIPSSVVGYNRTAACRGSLEAKPQEPAAPALPESSFLQLPRRGCPAFGDAPRLCVDDRPGRGFVPDERRSGAPYGGPH